mmetsp:Transcript_10712/g.33952  ORF Transcript_10712/g.33952 Transcript_10712/m.33952 type:complete len:319 (+) Transcript_10712:1114-2070(+)
MPSRNSFSASSGCMYEVSTAREIQIALSGLSGGDSGKKVKRASMRNLPDWSTSLSTSSMVLPSAFALSRNAWKRSTSSSLPSSLPSLSLSSTVTAHCGTTCFSKGNWWRPTTWVSVLACAANSSASGPTLYVRHVMDCSYNVSVPQQQLVNHTQQPQHMATPARAPHSSITSAPVSTPKDSDANMAATPKKPMSEHSVYMGNTGHMHAMSPQNRLRVQLGHCHSLPKSVRPSTKPSGSSPCFRMMRGRTTSTMNRHSMFMMVKGMSAMSATNMSELIALRRRAVSRPDERRRKPVQLYLTTMPPLTPGTVSGPCFATS